MYYMLYHDSRKIQMNRFTPETRGILSRFYKMYVFFDRQTFNKVLGMEKSNYFASLGSHVDCYSQNERII